METRIELLERYIANPEQVEQMMDLGCTKYLIEYRYRRTNPRIDDIDRIVEIPGNPEECQVLFYSGETVVCKANFDELCIIFNDLENGIFGEDEN